VERQKRPDFRELTPLHDVTRTVARRNIIRDVNRLVELNVFAELADVAASRTDFDVAVNCLPLPEQFERLSRHLPLLLLERRQGVRQGRQEGFDLRQSSLHFPVDLLITGLSGGRFFDQRVKTIFGIEVKDVLQKTKKLVAPGNIIKNLMKLRTGW